MPDFQWFVESIKNRALEYNRTLAKVYESDDWSFIIKSTTLIESAMSRLILAEVDDVRFEKHFGRVGFRSKLDLLVELNCLGRQERKFLELISEIRNRLAHDPNEMDFTFAIYVSKLEIQERRKFLENMNISNDQNIDKQYESFLLDTTKAAMWANIVAVLSVLAGQEEIIRNGPPIVGDNPYFREDETALLINDLWKDKSK